MPPAISVRPAEEDDPAAMAGVYRQVREYYPSRLTAGMELDATGVSRLMQTGSSFLVAEADGRLVGAVRHREDEGIAWFDLLASTRGGAGRALVGAIERLAQDAGIRLVRTRLPDLPVLEDYLARRGYTGISREPGEGEAGDTLVMEKRLPLLTVREQRRSDAAAIGRLTGEDLWRFEQNVLPGWFVAADGDRVVGVVSVRDAGGAVAEVAEPVLLPGYAGRGLEVWMVERAAHYAETNAYHSAELPITPYTEPLQRALEDRRWVPEGGRYVRRFAGRALPDERRDDWD